MNLLCTELAGKRNYSEQHNSLTSNLLFVDLCICVGEYFLVGDQEGVQICEVFGLKKLITYLCISYIVIVYLTVFFSFCLTMRT